MATLTGSASSLFVHASVLARHPRFHAHSIPRARGAIHTSDAIPAFRAQRRPLRQGRAQAVRRNADPDAGSYTVTAAVDKLVRARRSVWGRVLTRVRTAYVPERRAGWFLGRVNPWTWERPVLKGKEEVGNDLQNILKGACDGEQQSLLLNGRGGWLTCW
ncbi:uncharacterized protein [Triticum aestivum]|uniref:uncharacterized protein n=1 Tax=Triticum aestivum TaxID=4565 RepID=UPI001D01EB15|nr:uncharacterized protein LOC123143863 [Triticum aestivum]